MHNRYSSSLLEIIAGRRSSFRNVSKPLVFGMQKSCGHAHEGCRMVGHLIDRSKVSWRCTADAWIRGPGWEIVDQDRNRPLQIDLGDTWGCIFLVGFPNSFSGHHQVIYPLSAMSSLTCRRSFTFIGVLVTEQHQFRAAELWADKTFDAKWHLISKTLSLMKVTRTMLT